MVTTSNTFIEFSNEEDPNVPENERTIVIREEVKKSNVQKLTIASLIKQKENLLNQAQELQTKADEVQTQIDDLKSKLGIIV